MDSTTALYHGLKAVTDYFKLKITSVTKTVVMHLERSMMNGMKWYGLKPIFKEKEKKSIQI